MPALKIDPRLEPEQVARVLAVRAARDATRHAATLVAIETAARGEGNLVPLILEAVKAMATVGEISNVLRGVWGEHVETLVL